MIEDLDTTLRALLERELAEVLEPVPEITFAAPDDQFPPQSVTLPAIDLFLYDIRENRELRSNEVYLERRSDGSGTRSRAPVRVDFSYLVTAWPSPGVREPAADEHRLLGAVMIALLRHRKVPEDVLQGSLVTQNPPLPVAVLQPGPLQSLADFWQALGGKPKAALNYQITVSVDVEKAEQVTLVTEKVIRIGLKNPSRSGVEDLLE